MPKLYGFLKLKGIYVSHAPNPSITFNVTTVPLFATTHIVLPTSGCHGDSANLDIILLPSGGLGSLGLSWSPGSSYQASQLRLMCDFFGRNVFGTNDRTWRIHFGFNFVNVALLNLFKFLGNLWQVPCNVFCPMRAHKN